jgi:hypothetical protein
MIDYAHFPKDSVLLKSISKKIKDKQLKACLTRYTYRYRLAVAFEGLQASSVDKRTLAGYSCVTKLFLAYTAYDEIREAERLLLGKNKKRFHKIFDFHTANKLRRNIPLGELLKLSVAVTDKTLVKSLHNFYDNNNNEVMCIATAIRNCYAHGDFTASGGNLRTVRERAAVEKLTEVVLMKSNEIFSEMLE